MSIHNTHEIRPRLRSALRFHKQRIGHIPTLLAAAAEYGYEISLADPVTGDILFDFHSGPIDGVTARIIEAHLATTHGAIAVTRVPPNFIALDIAPDAVNGWHAVHVLAGMWGATDLRTDCDLPSNWTGGRVWAYLPDDQLPSRSFLADGQPTAYQKHPDHIASFRASFGISVLVPGEVIALEPLAGFTPSDILAGPAWDKPHFDLRDASQPRWLLDTSRHDNTDQSLFYHFGKTPDAFWRYLNHDGTRSVMWPESEVCEPLAVEVMASDLRRLWSPERGAPARWDRLRESAEARFDASRELMLDMFWRGPRQEGARQLVELRIAREVEAGRIPAEEAEAAIKDAAMPIIAQQMRWRDARQKRGHTAFTSLCKVYVGGQLQQPEGPTT